MIRLSGFFLLFLISGLPTLAQGQIEDIVSRNPFDPMRGQKEEEAAVEEKVEEVVQEKDIPKMMLDGTLIFGKKRFAIVRYVKPPEMDPPPSRESAAKNTARTRTNRNANKDRTRKPPKRKARRSGPKMATKTLERGDELVGYKVQAIENGAVTMARGSHTFKLELFSGEKENRGGSKQQVKLASAKKKPEIRKKPNKGKKNDKKPTAKPKKKSSKDGKGSLRDQKNQSKVKANKGQKRRKPPVEF
ncbi:hypothetical protein SCOR_32705 [Sulfidibacter corallicola]|uniref:Uncharacterized protein n=1 Tax=Sulfidibacter corallicola TaxID=2818388 RepID=A0A8A4TI28_SULCO|nr:hypothetical protein [Sulfidibacter corallicola]QTD49699.1 hypothetical protein J3U87_29295 [Sulfidibacter corallicola]